MQTLCDNGCRFNAQKITNVDKKTAKAVFFHSLLSIKESKIFLPSVRFI